MKNLDKLLKTENVNLPLTTRYTKEHLAKYVKDLRYLLKKVDDGAAIPAIHDLKAYFKDEHGLTISEGSIRRHLRQLQAGQDLWPAK